MSEEQAVTATEEQHHEETDADFEAGFSGQDATETPAVKTEGQEQQAQEQPPEPAQPETVQLTREMFDKLTKGVELAETVAKDRDKVFGKLGAFEQRLTQIVQEAPAGQQVEVSEADFEDLASEFPELAGATVKGLNKVLGKFRGGGQGVDPKQIETVVQDRVSQALSAQRAEFVGEVLSDRHEDWQQYVAPKKGEPETRPADYLEWLNTLKEDDRTAYLNSGSPYFVARKLDEFKKWREEKARQQADANAASRKEIIQAAVAPRGTGGSPPAKKTDDDDFVSGFKKHTSSE